MNEFKPKIVAFFCNWCSYRGADLAGTSRIKYPANVRVIRVPCSCRVDERLLMKAFVAGADGVLVCGCHPGDCHYQKGNLSTARRFIAFGPFMDSIGIGRERIRLEWISASEGEKIAETVKSFTNTIKQLGPGPFKKEAKSEVSAGLHPVR